MVSSKVCITFSRCPCNKLWRRSECLDIETTEVNRPSTKQLLNNFLRWFIRKAETIFGARFKNGLLIKKRCTRHKNLITPFFYKQPKFKQSPQKFLTY